MKKIYSFFYYSFVRVLNIIFSKLNIAIYYETKYGIKNINRKKLFSPKLAYDKSICEISGEELFLGIDALKNQYSHLGCSIKNSPHIELMRAISGLNIENSDYVRKERAGALDGRDIVYITNKRHKEIYDRQIELIRTGSYKPVSYYVVDEKKYISDGKHRAALLSHLGLPIKCVEVPIQRDTKEYFRKIRQKMIKKSDQYTKNIKLIDCIIEEGREQNDKF